MRTLSLAIEDNLMRLLLTLQDFLHTQVTPMDVHQEDQPNEVKPTANLKEVCPHIKK
jgi:hypothetical protein